MMQAGAASPAPSPLPRPTPSPAAPPDGLEACGQFLSRRVFGGDGESIGNVVFTALSALCQTALLVTLYVRRRRLRTWRVNRGLSASAVASHLLPVHILFVRFSVFVYVLQVITLIVPGLSYAVRPAGTSSETVPCTVKGMVWGLQHLCVDGVGVVLTLPGIGRRAVRTALCWTAPWAAFTAAVIGLACWFHPYFLEILAFYYACQSGLYAWALWSPRVFKRPAFRRYAYTWIALRGLALVSIAWEAYDPDSATCLNFTLVQATFCVVVPWAIYRAFQTDTSYWFGHAYALVDAESGAQQAACRGGGGVNSRGIDVRTPLIGTALAPNLMGSLERGIETLERSDVVSFAELSVGVTSLLGAGGTAKVFRASFRGRPAACKLVFSPDVTERTVRAFFREASYLRRCAPHPNIVSLLGVCVAPPSLAHVLELCDGSLSDYLMTSRLRSASPAAGRRGADRFLDAAVQCSRAVAHMHALNILHRDIKSLNFLVVGAAGGPSLRRSSAAPLASRSVDSWNPIATSSMIVKLADMDLAVHANEEGVAVVETEGAANKKDDEGQETPRVGGRRGVQGVLGTPQWAAPEVLRAEAGASTKSADVFALGVVIWECLTLEEPFPARGLREMTRSVGRGGERLRVPDRAVEEGWKPLLDGCWNENPAERPAAEDVVVILETILEARQTPGIPS